MESHGKTSKIIWQKFQTLYFLCEEEMVRKKRVLEDIQVFLEKRELRRIEDGEQLVITLQIRPNDVKPQGQASNGTQ